MGLMPTSDSVFFFTCAVFFGCLLIPPAFDLPIVALFLGATPCLVHMKNPFKMKAQKALLQNEGAKLIQK